jgi:hypothetical protein
MLSVFDTERAETALKPEPEPESEPDVENASASTPS